MKTNKLLTLFLLRTFILSGLSLADSPKPFRTFVTIESYHQESNGRKSDSTSQVQLEVKLGPNQKLVLPEPKKFWTVQNQKSQPIHQTFEVPSELIQQDGFSFEITMIEKGKTILPCSIKVTELSKFNRSYMCRTDVNFQSNQQHIPEDKLAKQGVEVRVFSDLNVKNKELPKNLLVFRN